MITMLTSPTAIKPVGQEEGHVCKVYVKRNHISISPVQI